MSGNRVGVAAVAVSVLVGCSAPAPPSGDTAPPAAVGAQTAQPTLPSTAQPVLAPDPARIVDDLVAGGVDVITGEVLATGRRELLPFVREQAVSTTRHRFGHVAG